MGMSPRMVDEMSLWEFLMAASGYAESQGTDMDTPLSEAEIEDLGRLIDR